MKAKFTKGTEDSMARCERILDVVRDNPHVMPSVDVLATADCGCRVVRRGAEVCIEQCPLHSAAPEMYEALEDARDRLRKIANLLNGPPKDGDRFQAYSLAYDGKQVKALAKARGET